MNMILMKTATASDEQLWRLACEGDREAFTRIVERYQSLVCSLAYSACGTLGTSEDMAQETFITAWHRLKDLREPGKLRQWLCGIVRNIAANAVRRDLRRGGEPESLDAAADQHSGESDPAAQAITREEETLLWRTLAEMPAGYREPLVLFYREEKSVAEVALKLDLTEDTVKQRLSRGRAMLREEMTALVESTLTRTRPGRAFTTGVLAALPFTVLPSASAAAASAVAGKGLATAAKGTAGGLGLGAVFGPLIGLSIGWFSSRLIASTARSPRERACILRHARRIVIFCFVMSLGLAAILSQAGKLYTASPLWVIVGIAAWLGVLLGTILWTSSRMNGDVLRIRAETGTGDADYSAKLATVGLKLFAPIHHESSARLLGWPLFALRIGSLDAGSHRSHTARGWIAIGDVAISPLFAFGGIAVAPVAVGGLTVGLLSLSLWGAAVGVLSFGSLAVGWCAFGIASAGWRAAVGGGVALARDYAIGGVAHAAEANTAAAKQWLTEQWFSPIIGIFAGHAHWIILLTVVLSLVVVARRIWQLRRLTH